MLTQSEIDAIREASEKAIPYPNQPHTDLADLFTESERMGYRKGATVERQRAKVLLDALLKAKAEIVTLTDSDQPANKIHYPKYIDKALNTYNKNKPNDKERKTEVD